MSQPISKLECIDCGKTYTTMEIRYHCDCGGLLEVKHDIDRIKRTNLDLKHEFSERLKAKNFPHASGVWRYKELILPELPVDYIVSKPEGNTNLYHNKMLCKAFGLNRLYLKHEGENPTLSFKDRGMTAGVSWANYMGVEVVACASTGDTSAAMAAYAAELEDVSGVVFLPHNKISPEQLSQAISYGAKTLALDTNFDGCMKLVREVCLNHPVYLLNSMNPFRIEGQKSIGIESIQQLNWQVPDWFVIPVGNAGNLSALGKGLKELYELGIIDRLPRIAAVQAKAANPFFKSFVTDFSEHISVVPEDTFAAAIRIGDPVSHKKAARVINDFHGVVEDVSEEELMAAKEQADRSGVAVCPNSGVALAGLKKLLDRKVIKKDQTVVAIMTAHGLKYSKVSVEYHSDMIDGFSPSDANAPVRLSAEASAIIKELKLG